jgi:hypothetical protein
MAHPSKRKGDGFEREMVALLQGYGIAAEKVPLSGAVKGGAFDRDLNVSVPVQGADWTAECKRRARQFKTIDAMLGPNKLLFCRDDRSRPLVVMTVETFAQLALFTVLTAIEKDESRGCHSPANHGVE